MIAYLIKSGLFLALLLVIYLVLLERHKMHSFNRIFLLTALVVGLTVPLFSVDILRNKLVTEAPTEIVKSIASTSSDLVAKVAEYPSNRSKVTEPTYTELGELNSNEIGYKRNFSYHFLKGLFLIFYSMVCFFLFLRMGIVLYRFYKKIKINQSLAYKPARLVLVDEAVSPHTFLSTIFVNKEQYQSGKISEQIFEHELTHVQQKHSLDVLFIELLRIIFWFNPVFYFYKRAIQINHEFLADESVLNKTNDPISYKNLLLESVLPSYKTDLSSSFNYALTKKRFLMMLKESSSLSTISRKIVLIPAIATLALIFSTEVLQEKRTYEIDGVKYIEAFQPGSLDSDLILLNKIEDMERSIFNHKWMYYDEDGNPFTGEWLTEDTSEDNKITSRSEIQAGRLLSRTNYYEVSKPYIYSTFRSSFRGEKVLYISFDKNESISGINTFNMEADEIWTLSIFSLNEEGVWSGYERLGESVEGGMGEIYLATTFDQSWNIVDQELFSEEGELTLKREHKVIATNDAKIKYENTLLEYQRVLSKNNKEDLPLVYAELELVYFRWRAFEKDLNGINAQFPTLPVRSKK